MSHGQLQPCCPSQVGAELECFVLCLVLSCVVCKPCMLVHRSRETANMEYIKNIVHHYMCTDSTDQQQMLPALATAPHFSPEEVRL